MRCDQTIALTASRDGFPDLLQRIGFHDDEKKSNFNFLTNHFDLPALTIARLYKSRWKVELSFKWIKQHLRIKRFYGASEDAVKIQNWVAISIYVLVAIVKKRLVLKLSLYTILQVLSVTLFEKVSILEAFTILYQKDNEYTSCNQLKLFDF